MDIGEETSALVRALAADADTSGAIVGGVVERLHRMEDQARLEGAGRQALQKIMSARRVLGDRVDFGRASASFAPE